MAVIGIFFGSETGNSEKVANMLKDKLAAMMGEEVADVINIAEASVEKFQEYPLYILGTSTWNIGDIQASWEVFLPKLDNIELKNKVFAVYGLGDQDAYADNFVDGMGTLAKAITEKSGTIIANWPIAGYNFNASTAKKDGDNFVGLAIDEDQQSDLTEERVSKWAEQIKTEMRLAEIFC